MVFLTDGSVLRLCSPQYAWYHLQSRLTLIPIHVLKACIKQYMQGLLAAMSIAFIRDFMKANLWHSAGQQNCCCNWALAIRDFDLQSWWSRPGIDMWLCGICGEGVAIVFARMNVKCGSSVINMCISLTTYYAYQLMHIWRSPINKYSNLITKCLKYFVTCVTVHKCVLFFLCCDVICCFSCVCLGYCFSCEVVSYCLFVVKINKYICACLSPWG